MDFSLYALQARVGTDLVNPFGLAIDPMEAYRVNSLLPQPLFAAAAPELRGTGDKQDVFLWESGESKLFSGPLPSYKQTLGTCVSQGWGRAAQHLLLIEVAAGKSSLPRGPGKPEEGGNQQIKYVATEPIYAGSRIEVGKGRLGRDEGSMGSWAAKFVSEWGILMRMPYENGKYSFFAAGGETMDSPVISDDRLAQSWGTSRDGVPADIEDDAKLHPIKTVAVCETFEEARDALANLYPVPVASNQGFAMERSNDGFCRPSGSWAHQMCFVGCGVAKGNKPFLVCQNSWGDYLGAGKLTLDNGREVALPMGAFAVEAATANRMLKQGDSHVASHLKGFPRQKPDFSLYA